MRRILRALDEDAERWFMLVCYAFVCFVIVQEVARRFLLNYSSAWAEETARYAFIYLGWVGAAYAVKERVHVRFDLLLHALPRRLQGWIYVAGEVCTIAFACIAFWYSMHTIGTLLKFDGATPVLRVNKAWFQVAVPIGFALIVWRSAQALRNDIADLRAGRPANAGKAMFEG